MVGIGFSGFGEIGAVVVQGVVGAIFRKLWLDCGLVWVRV